eukprot:UN33807
MRTFMSKPKDEIHKDQRSDEEVVIDAGPGTTGTRTMAAVLKKFGYICKHQDLGDYGQTLKIRIQDSSLSLGEECYEFYDQFDFRYPDNHYNCFTDNPFGAYFWDMYWTYPNAKWVMTTREPYAWIERKKSKDHNSSFK